MEEKLKYQQFTKCLSHELIWKNRTKNQKINEFGSLPSNQLKHDMIKVKNFLVLLVLVQFQAYLFYVVFIFWSRSEESKFIVFQCLLMNFKENRNLISRALSNFGVGNKIPTLLEEVGVWIYFTVFHFYPYI